MPGVLVPSYRQRLSYHAGLLGGICFLVSVLLIIGNLETRGRIADHVDEERRATLAQVLPPGLYDNQPLAEARQLPQEGVFIAPPTLYPATREGAYSGAALQTAVFGWGSEIQFILGVNAAGAITGVRVISHRETPGLGDKIDISRDNWITRFDGHSLANTSESEWAVKKDGGVFDQFTGATITPRALVRGIHQSLVVLDRERQRRLAGAAGAPAAQEEQP